jgi:hypothetical protein
MTDYSYVTGQLGSESAVEGWWAVKGDTLEVYSFQQTVHGQTRSPGCLLKSVQLEDGDDPRLIALKLLRDKATTGRGYFGATGPLRYPDAGWF